MIRRIFNLLVKIGCVAILLGLVYLYISSLLIPSVDPFLEILRFLWEHAAFIVCGTIFLIVMLFPAWLKLD
jgi:hypothetical protein